MTCISATKSPNMLKWHPMIARTISYHPVLQNMSFDFLCLMNINKTFGIKSKITENEGGIHRKSHVSPLLIDLVSYN